MPQRDWLLAVLCSVFAGMAVTAQTVVNARLTTKIGLPQCMAIVSVITLGLSLAAWAVAPNWPQEPTRVRTTWVEYVGGFFGFAIIVGLAVAAARIGVGRTLTLAIVAQLVLALAIDHFGWAGVRRAITLEQVAGVGLLAAGAWLVLRR
jgi:transporter family-2 protein